MWFACAKDAARRHRINPLAAPRMAAREPLQPEPATAQYAVSFHRLEKIMRARRLKAAAPARPASQPVEHRRNEPLVTQDKHANQEHTDTMELRWASCSHSADNA